MPVFGETASGRYQKYLSPDRPAERENDNETARIETAFSNLQLNTATAPTLPQTTRLCDHEPPRSYISGPTRVVGVEWCSECSAVFLRGQEITTPLPRNHTQKHTQSQSQICTPTSCSASSPHSSCSTLLQPFRSPGSSSGAKRISRASTTTLSSAAGRRDWPSPIGCLKMKTVSRLLVGWLVALGVSLIAVCRIRARHRGRCTVRSTIPPCEWTPLIVPAVSATTKRTS